MFIGLFQERMSNLKEEISKLRAAVPSYKLISFDKQAKIAASRAGEEEDKCGDDKKRPSKGGGGGGGCVIS